MSKHSGHNETNFGLTSSATNVIIGKDRAACVGRLPFRPERHARLREKLAYSTAGLGRWAATPDTACRCHDNQ